MKLVITSAVLLCVLSYGLTAHTGACFKDILLSNNGVQNVTSPGFPQPYGPNVTCGWKIRASSKDHLVGVYIASFQLEESGKCQGASLSFYDGSDTSGGLLLQLCGIEAKESSVLSSDDTMFIEFASGAVSNGIGFSLIVIDVEQCGGRLTATSDSLNLTSPGYPYTYFNNLTCIWIITAENENDTIAAVTKSSDIYPNTEPWNMRDGDMVRVFNGNITGEEQYLGAFNSTNTPTYYSSKDSLLIEFTTDGSITRQGFRMEYTARPEGNCNGTLFIYDTPVYILSPGYPDSYLSNLNCVIMMGKITEPQNMRLDVLSLDIEGDYPQCDNDSVTLYGGYNGLENTIGEFCGNSTTSPVGPYYSNGFFMTLVFKTGSDTSGTGFRLSVSPTSRKVVPPPTKVCGPRFLNATTYPNFLQSPGYPVMSQNNLDCIWVITASKPQMMVRIDVIDSDVQTESWDYLSCKYSRVTAYNGPSINNDTILFWCGVSRPSLQSTGPAMTVQFTTQYSNDKRGFKLKYVETNETFRCGGIVNVTTNEDTILAGPFLNSQDCRWTIRAPTGTNIQVNITNVKIIFPPASSKCDMGYLELYDGNNDGSTTPGRWCGRHDSQYISSGNTITARMNSGGTDRYEGLQIYMKAGHFPVSSNKILSASVLDEYLTSPNYPFDCPRITESTWKIEGGDLDNWKIKITVLNSTLDNSDGCDNDYVEAFDGSDSNAPSLGRWCGENTPTKTGSASTMFLKFKSNSTHNLGRGFKIRYVIELRGIDTGFSILGVIVGCSVAGGIALLTFIGLFVRHMLGRATGAKQPLITKK
ncbi:deleted in malignant brain tumors 1 protein-like [Haliotis rubra]|uniref:deleted in malignant brain tumors 1 protein-like n=1 Tax=Haliotis rubra TaxID=36100 RepID=UPI001EE57668|nr:deleted in malignant brain tumors 1 protein-like [Haliotis rubra]